MASPKAQKNGKGESSEANQTKNRSPLPIVLYPVLSQFYPHVLRSNKDETTVELLELLEIGCFEQFTAFGITL